MNERFIVSCVVLFYVVVVVFFVLLFAKQICYKNNNHLKPKFKIEIEIKKK
jgi:hypothetical protein